jgi:hypothetical protein
LDYRDYGTLHGNDTIGTLHSRDYIKHISYLTDLHSVQNMEVRQTGAARQYLHAIPGKFL